MLLPGCVLLVVLLCSGWCSAASARDQKEDPPLVEFINQLLALKIESRDPLEWWGDLEKQTKLGVDNALNLVLPIIMDIAKNVDISSDCISSILNLISGLRRLKPWAFKMLDAFGKPVPGILQGTLTFFGYHEECLNVTVFKSDGKENFKGKYCTAMFLPPLPNKGKYYPSSKPLKQLNNFTSNKRTILRDFSDRAQIFYTLPIQLDVCIPSVCSNRDIKNAIDYVVRDYLISVTVPYCNVKEDVGLQGHQIFIIILFVILFIFIVVGTGIDIVRRHSAGNMSLMTKTETYGAKLLRSFSVVTNLNMLFYTDVTHKRLASMHGMRLLSMCWIIFATSYSGFNIRIISNLLELERIGQYFIFQFIFNSSVAMDSFFFLSGTMLSYLTFGMVKRNKGRFNILGFVIRRLWRVTPTIMFFIAGYILLGDNRIGGPLWHQTMAADIDNCKRYWYTNLLYVSNLVLMPEQYCLYDSWYFSCDMQLHLIALVVLCTMCKWPLVGHAFNGILVALSIFANGYITYIRKFPPALLISYHDPDLQRDYDAYLYHQPWCHLAVYCVGIWTGYFMFTYPKFKFTRIQINAGWFVSLTSMVAIIHSTYIWNNVEADLPTLTESVVYACLHRVCWSLALSWITVACVYGHAGMVNRFLSWEAFIPFGKLTFMVFLMQTFTRFLLNGILQERIPMSHLAAIFVFFTILVNVYFMSFFFHIIIDAPVFTMRRIILKKQHLERTLSAITRDLDNPKEEKPHNETLRTNSYDLPSP